MPHVLKTAAALIALGLAAPLLGACANPDAAAPPGGPIALTQQTDAAFAAYLRKVRVTRPGAFAVSPDGRNSFYTWCEDTVCAVSNYSIPALRGCRSISGTPCVVLHVRNDQRLAFTRTGGDAPGRHGSEEQRPLEYDVHDR